MLNKTRKRNKVLRTSPLRLALNAKPPMKVNVTKSHLDLARAVIDTRLHGADADDAIFGLMNCTYVNSFQALVSFGSGQLHSIWNDGAGQLQEKYPGCKTFEELMAGPLRDIKSALKELAELKGIEPLHSACPKLWQQLNEFLKRHRDFFLHPNPDKFSDMVEESGNLEWNFASKTASGIIGHLFDACGSEVPKWINESGLASKGFEIKCI